MKKLTKKEVKKEMKEVKETIKKAKILTPKIKSILKDKGYTFCELGTGNSAYTSSKNVSVLNIKSQKYLNGKFLVIGCSNRQHGKGCIYQGFVKKIID